MLVYQTLGLYAVVAMESASIFLVLILVHGTVFIVLFLSAYFLTNRGRFIGSKPLARKKSLIEQRLVLEVLSACASERNLSDVVRSIGIHAAELTGFGEWIIWLRENGSFQLAEFSLGGRDIQRGELSGQYVEAITTWIMQNATPLTLQKNMIERLESQRARQALEGFVGGLVVPLMDGQRVIGIAALGGGRTSPDKRSEQFLVLFGAFAAMLIKEAKYYQQRLRDESLAKLGKMAAMLAHEIRNPLSFIRSAAEILQIGRADPGKRKQMIAGMTEEIDRISKRVDELLSLGRIDPRLFRPIDLVQVCGKAVALARGRAEQSGIKLETELSADHLVAEGDADRLLQLLENLLINAIQATGSDGRVVVSCASNNGTVRIAVEDSGEGIDQKTAEHIFEPFFSTKDRGTGLGLAICFSIARAHGGSLKLEHTSPAGSCFSVLIPLREKKTR